MRNSIHTLLYFEHFLKYVNNLMKDKVLNIILLKMLLLLCTDKLDQQDFIKQSSPSIFQSIIQYTYN
jgi:hypothetical protein